MLSVKARYQGALAEHLAYKKAYKRAYASMLKALDRGLGGVAEIEKFKYERAKNMFLENKKNMRVAALAYALVSGKTFEDVEVYSIPVGKEYDLALAVSDLIGYVCCDGRAWKCSVGNVVAWLEESDKTFKELYCGRACWKD